MQTDTAPNFFRTLRADIERDGIGLEDGDCGLIVKTDGSVRLFSTGVDGLKRPQEEWGEREHQLIETGKKLTALIVAMSNSQIMDMLLNLAADVIDETALGHIARPN